MTPSQNKQLIGKVSFSSLKTQKLVSPMIVVLLQSTPNVFFFENKTLNQRKSPLSFLLGYEQNSGKVERSQFIELSKIGPSNGRNERKFE